MSTLLASLGRWSYRHPWRVVVAWLLLLALAGGGVALLAKGTDNAFTIPGTEAQEGLAQLGRTFPQASGTSAQLVVVAADGDRIDDAPYTTDIDGAVDDLGGIDGVLAVTDPYSELVNGLISDDGSAAIIRLQFDGAATDVTPETKSELRAVAADLRDELPAGSEVAVGGDLFSQSVPALSIVEAVGVLLALFVLIVTFRSAVIAVFPLVSALIGVALAIALIFMATAFASVSSTTPLLAVMLGLAVGIDYALFIMARHQDQVRTGIPPEESAARAVGTAGSAVVFAGITVLIALIGLSFAGIPFLTTMGIAASVAVAIAVLVALTLTPALLGFAKGRVVGWRRRTPRRRRSRAGAPSVDSSTATARRGFASRWVGATTRHPLVVTIGVVVLLGILAIPAASLRLALPNAGMQPKGSEARESYELVSEHFGPGYNGPLILTGTIVTSTDPVTLMQDLGDEVAAIPGVKEVALATPNETADTGIVQLIPETAPDDPATSDLVRELRAHHDEWLDEYGVDLKVTGFTAVAIDISDRLGAALLPFGIFVVGLSLILLTIVFRSIWVPVTAALGYLLSVAAAFGVIAAVFEWGWLADALHVAKTGPIISFMPIILMGVLFGLAMDYQVFLVSRMREDWVHSRGKETDARGVAIAAVRSGFTASARVVTAAAVIMFAVFAAFVPEGDTSIKPIALGLAAGIAIDAFLVRMTLVPAVLALLGAKAWWIPRWLDRVLPRLDIEGEAVEREIALADWPGPGVDAVVVGADVVVGDIRPVDIVLAPGASLVVAGDDPVAAQALLLAIAGRLPIDDGRLRVDGHLLPERAAWVRREVGVALLADGEPVAQVRRALRGSPALVVIDGLDRVDDVTAEHIARAIRETSASARETVPSPELELSPALESSPAPALVAPRPALIVSTPDVGAALALLQSAGRPGAAVLDLAATRGSVTRRDADAPSTPRMVTA